MLRPTRALWQLVAGVVLAVSALAQTGQDHFSTDLRTKYGPPLARQTFLVPGGEMLVDYAANGNVCGIQLPPIAPETSRPEVLSPKGTDDFVLQLVPPPVRGKEVRRLIEGSGINDVSIVEYENVTIAEILHGGRRTGVTVTFHHETCQDRR